MKKHGTMIALLVVLVAFVGLYFLMAGINKKQAEKELQQDVMVTNLAELKELEYSDGKTTLSFVKEKGVWYVKEDKTIVLTDIQMNSMEGTLVGIVAVRQLEKADALADYGLEEPSYTITMKDKEGKEAVVYIGDAVGENYYATAGDKTVVYIVESVVVDALEFDLEVLEETAEEDTTETTE